MYKKLFLVYASFFFLFMPAVLADDVFAHIRIQFETVLGDIGAGIGSLFTGMGAGLTIFIILLAVVGMIAFIISAIAKRAGYGEDGYQSPPPEGDGYQRPV